MNELMVLDDLTAVNLFEENKVEGIVLNIIKESETLVPVVSTAKGRDDIIDFVKNIRKCSKILDDIGKNHVALQKALPKKTDVKRKKMRDDLETLYDKVRLPLTEWEDEEKANKDRILNKINALMAMPCGVACDRISNKVLAKIFLDEIQATVIDDSFGDSIEHAQKTKSENELIVKDVIANFEIEEKAEVKRIEVAKQEQIERDDRIAKEATEQAERAAEQAIKYAKEAEELAVENAKIAKTEADQWTKDAKLREEAALERAKLKAEQAVKDEKDRAEKERLAGIAAQEKLAANKKHSARINNEIVNAIQLVMSEMPSGNAKEAKLIAKSIVIAIAKNEIPNVSIKY